VICGGGIRYSTAHQAFQEFVACAALSFAETQAGEGALVSEHALNLVGLGVTGGLPTCWLRRRI